LCESERPRERIFSTGAASLATGELLAVLLRSGSPGESALELAQRLLASVNGRLSELFNMSPEQLEQFSGIGPGKAASVVAAFELGKRFLQEQPCPESRPLVSGRMVYDLMVPLLKGLQHEESWIIWLNSRNCATGKSRINTGGMTSTVLDIRRIAKMALERNAAGVILVHNHPGGDPSPSGADLRQTNMLSEAMKAIGIKLIDHIIVAAGSFFSFSADRVTQA